MEVSSTSSTDSKKQQRSPPDGGDCRTQKKRRKVTTKGRTLSEKAGLQFPVRKVLEKLQRSGVASKIGVGAPVYLSATLEFLTKRVFENLTDGSNLDKIRPHHLKEAILGDESLREYAKTIESKTSPGIASPNSHVYDCLSGVIVSIDGNVGVGKSELASDILGFLKGTLSDSDDSEQEGEGKSAEETGFFPGNLILENLDQSIVHSFYSYPEDFTFGYLVYLLNVTFGHLQNAQQFVAGNSFCVLDRSPLSVMALTYECVSRNLISKAQMDLLMKSMATRAQNVFLKYIVYLEADPVELFEREFGARYPNISRYFFEGIDDFLFENCLKQLVSNRNVIVFRWHNPESKIGVVIERIMEQINSTRTLPTIHVCVIEESMIPRNKIIYREQKDILREFKKLKQLWKDSAVYHVGSGTRKNAISSDNFLSDGDSSSYEDDSEEDESDSKLSEEYLELGNLIEDELEAHEEERKIIESCDVFIDLMLWMNPRNEFKRVVMDHIALFHSICFYAHPDDKEMLDDCPVYQWFCVDK